MPRSAAGTYTLPSAAFVSGTVISATPINLDFSDMATALTASLDTAGALSMTGAFKLARGSLSAPALAPALKTNSGFIYDGTNLILSLNGAAAQYWNGSDGSNVFPSRVGLSTSALAFYQCQFVFTSTTVLTLNVYNGNLLTINGFSYLIPSSGVTLSNSGVVINTFYYIYAYAVGTTITLEYSTVSPTANTTYGAKQKTGDATRLLVGACYIDSSGTFKDADGVKYVISYFNRKIKRSITVFTVARSVTCTGVGNILEFNTEIRNNFITWNDEYVRYFGAYNGMVSGASGNDNFLFICIDSGSGAIAGWAGTYTVNTGTQPSYGVELTYQSNPTSITENAVHFATLSTSGANTVSIQVNGGAIDKTTGAGSSLIVEVNG